MSFDGIVTKTVVAELNQVLINGKINTIYQPNKNEILINIYNKKLYALKACIDSANYGIYLTTNAKQNPMVAPNFCMLLRKYLVGTRIINIKSYDLERIVKITVQGYNELNDLVEKKLIIEIMGKHSNIILVNDKGYIIDSLRHIENETRSILPLRYYEYPKLIKYSLLEIDKFEDFYKIISQEQNIIEALSNNFIGIGKSFVKYVCNKLNITELNESNLEIIYNYIKKVINEIDNNTIIPVSVEEKEYVVDIGETKKLCVNYFLDDFYFKKEKTENLKNYRNNVLRTILALLKKLTKRLENIDAKLKECEQIDLYKLYGELITSNLYKFKDERLESVELDNYYTGEKVNIPLDKTISISNNVKKYYKKYNKLKSTLEIVTKQKKDTQRELYYIQSIIYELENADNVEEIDEIYTEITENLLFKSVSNKKVKFKTAKKENLIKPMEYEIDGFKVLVGKNNKQNDYLTFKIANKNDIWFHTQEIHGSHVVLRTEGKLPGEKVISKTAAIAAYYSKGKQAGKVLVDYTNIKNVKKPSGAKPGMVIYNNYKSIRVQPNVVVKS